MIKKINVEEAIGKPLLHDITGILKDGFKGVVFKRNHIIKPEDVETLKDIGKEHIYVGDLEEDQVHEEDAIMELIPHILGENVSASGLSEGKTNIISDVDGVFVLDRQGLYEINNLGDFTIATIKSFTKVKKKDKLAGARIVPLYTEREKVNKAIETAKKRGSIFKVLPYKRLKVGSIITGDEVFYGRIQDKFERVLRKKYSEFDTEILGFTFCPDDLEKINEAVEKYLEMGADLIIFTGGMSVDPDDLTPSAIRNTGAEILVQGLPVQPGNMLTVGKLGKTYLVGVPGASIHSEITSFDIFLPRIYAGLDLKRQDFIELGEGGLL